MEWWSSIRKKDIKITIITWSNCVERCTLWNFLCYKQFFLFFKQHCNINLDTSFFETSFTAWTKRTWTKWSKPREDNLNTQKKKTERKSSYDISNTAGGCVWGCVWVCGWVGGSGVGGGQIGAQCNHNTPDQAHYAIKIHHSHYDAKHTASLLPKDLQVFAHTY